MGFVEELNRDMENSLTEQLRNNPKKLIVWKTRARKCDISTFLEYDDKGYRREIFRDNLDFRPIPVFFVEEIKKLLQEGYTISDDELTQRAYKFFSSEVEKINAKNEELKPILDEIKKLQSQADEIVKNFNKGYDERKSMFYSSIEDNSNYIFCSIMGHIKKDECKKDCSFWSANGCKK